MFTIYYVTCCPWVYIFINNKKHNYIEVTLKKLKHNRKSLEKKFERTIKIYSIEKYLNLDLNKKLSFHVT